MGIPNHPISRIEQYLAGICAALGVEPDPEGGENMKVLYFDEVESTMVPRTGENYATYQEFADSQAMESDVVIPVYINGRIAIESHDERDGFAFTICDGVMSEESESKVYVCVYHIDSGTDEPGAYNFTMDMYSIVLTEES